AAAVAAQPLLEDREPVRYERGRSRRRRAGARALVRTVGGRRLHGGGVPGRESGHAEGRGRKDGALRADEIEERGRRRLFAPRGFPRRRVFPTFPVAPTPASSRLPRAWASATAFTRIGSGGSRPARSAPSRFSLSARLGATRRPPISILLRF